MTRMHHFTRRVPALALVLAVIPWLLPAQTSRGGQDSGYGQLSVGSDVHDDISGPLRDTPILPPVLLKVRSQHPAPAAAKRTASDSNSVAPAPDLVDGGPGAATTLGYFNIAGVGNCFTGPGGAFTPATTPSEATGAVGTTQYLQWVDGSFAVFSKATGATLYGPAAGNTLWSGFGGPCETDNDGQPTVNFDKLAKRWVLSQHAISSGSPYLQCVAVSTTDDATGTWNRYSFQIAFANTSWTNEDAKLGVWPDGYYLSFDMYSGTTLMGPKLCAVQRSTMLLGHPSGIQCVQLQAQYYSPVVSDLDSPTAPPSGAPAYFAADDLVFFAIDLWKFHVNWSDSQQSTLSLPILLQQATYTGACGGFAAPSCVPQPNGMKLDPSGNHLTGRMPYRNYGTYQSLLTSETTEAVTTIHVYEMRIGSNGDASMFQQGELQDTPASYRFISSIAADRAGNIAVAYNSSNAELWPSQYVSSRAPGDTPGTFGNETLLNPGNGSQTTPEWDTRASLTVDPIADCTFYYTQQYQPMDGTNNWVTQIEDFTLGGCYAPITLQTTPVNLNVTASGSGITASHLAPYSGQFPEGSSIKIAATATQDGAAGVRYVFANWSDAGALSHNVVLPSAGGTYTANFTTQYLLTLTVNPAGAGTVAPSVTTYYNSGSAVNITATPAAGYSFTSWTGSVANPTAATTSVSMTGPQIVKANFTPLLTTVNMALTGKSGAANARVWAFSFTNAGPGQANNIKINRFSLTQTAGTACTPVRISTLPLTIGSVAPGDVIDGNVPIDFSSCASNALFSLIMTIAENAGASTTTLNLTNQSQ